MKKTFLTKEEILHLAKLVKLQLTDEEIEKYQNQLSETVDYVKNLDELDTKDIKPTNSVVDLKNVMFVDGAKNEKGLNVKEAVSNAKKIKDGMFQVGRIME